MTGQASQVIAQHEILFSVRTGVTILVAKNTFFDACEKESPDFYVNPQEPKDLRIALSGHDAIIKDVNMDYIEEALERGSFMLYELENDEVVRCTACKRQNHMS